MVERKRSALQLSPRYMTFTLSRTCPRHCRAPSPPWSAVPLHVFFVVLFVFSFTLVGCGGNDSSKITLLSPDGRELFVKIEIADDDTERQQGLMFREYLDADAGMLFVFEQPRALSFWMKNTLIPLDILYFDAAGDLVSSTTMIPCAEGDQCPGYPSRGAAQYALEVNEGYVKTNGIGKGWSLVLPE